MSYFSGAKLRQIRESKRLTLSDVCEQTGVSRAQISRIENGKTDPRMSTVTRMLSCYRASLGDLELTAPAVFSMNEVRERANQGAQKLAQVGLSVSDPYDRLDRKAELQVDVQAEREALATRT